MPLRKPRKNRSSHQRLHQSPVERLYREQHRVPNRLTRARQPWKRRLIGGGLVLLALIAAAAWAGLLLFRPLSAPTSGDMTLLIDAPPAAPIGADLTYTITMINDDRVPLARTALEVRLPPHFTLIEAEPLPDDTRGLQWTIGTIPARGKQTVTIRGQLFGEPGTAANIEAIALYRPANFNADFEQVARTTTTLGASPFLLTVTGPKQSIPGDPVLYTITYRATESVTLPPGSILLELPRSFHVTETTPERSRDDALEWQIGELTDNTQGTITIRGQYTQGSRNPIPAMTSLRIAPIDRAPITIASHQIGTEVLGGDARLFTTVNDQTSNFAAPPGSDLRARLTLRNDGNDALEGINAQIFLDATSVTEQSILRTSAADLNGATLSEEQLAAGFRRIALTWTPESAPELQRLDPGAQAQLNITIPIHTAETLAGFPSAGQVIIEGAITIDKTGALKRLRRVSTDAISIEIK
jgi:hypothetical protein